MQFLYMLVALLVVALLGGRPLLRAWFYPKPPPLEPVTDQTLDVLLARLDAWLREQAPAVAESLRPGLSDERLEKLEAEGRLRLTDEMRALYRWHDGSERQQADEFIPSYRFLPLAESLRERAAMKEQVRSLPPVQRMWFELFAGHRTGWLTVLTNGSGDGYFYDQARRRSPGCFFFSMHDEHWYLFFPTLADFVGAVLECFESGAFRPSRGGGPLRWNVEKSMEIMGRHAWTMAG